MPRSIEIICQNTNTTYHYPLGSSLLEIIKSQSIALPYPILGARVNNKVEELNYEIIHPKIIEFFDITDPDGQRMYFRGVSFLLIKAAKELYPEATIRIEHSVAKGYYCEFDHPGQSLTPAHVKSLKNKMQELVKEDIPFVKKEIRAEKARELFRQNGFFHKAKLFKDCPEFFTSVYYLGNQVDYFYGYLVPATGYLTNFEVEPFYNGMLMRLPNPEDPSQLEKKIRQDKMYEIFQEYSNWGRVLGVESIADINDEVKARREGELIKVGEALHEKKVVEIVGQILARKPAPRIVLIAGPSASGKTTFAKRLGVQLRVAGKRLQALSLDNYFVDRAHTPLDENGEKNYEALEAIHLDLLNKDINALLQGKTIQIPRFDFSEGKRIYDGRTMQLDENGILLIEGIHALNPKLLGQVNAAQLFRVYISALTQVGIDSHNRIPTTDNRLIRRMVRDAKYRGYTALETLRRWPSVRRGEEKNIFPFQENCDVMFNSALIFELGVLKKYAARLLRDVPPVEPEYAEAMRLLKFLSYFKQIPATEIPPTSILREFLYGSTFSYK